MWSSQQTLVTFSLQSRPTLKVLMSGSKSDQSFLSELYMKKLILYWILVLILTWWCLVYTEDSPRLSRQWNVSTPQTRTDTALNWPCPVYGRIRKFKEDGQPVACCLPEKNTLKKKVQVPGEEIGHQVLHSEEQREVDGAGDCCDCWELSVVTAATYRPRMQQCGPCQLWWLD